MERGAMSRGVVMTADDFRHVIEGWLTNFILIAVAVAGVLEVFRAFGFLPPWAARFLFRYRLDENIQLLRSLGMDVDAVRRRNAAASLDSIAPSVLADGVKTRLAAMTINKDVALGSTARIKINGYIDLMGACTDEVTAKMFARDLAAHWRSLLESGGLVANEKIDFIVTPKNGAPLLGGAFAVRLRRPLLLYNPQAKFESSTPDVNTPARKSLTSYYMKYL
jgi:hypothetical protein